MKIFLSSLLLIIISIINLSSAAGIIEENVDIGGRLIVEGDFEEAMELFDDNTANNLDLAPRMV
jgi:hypothetical protein